MAQEARVIGTVARLEPVKNLSALLAAFQRMAASMPDVHLVMIGDGSERAGLEQLVSAAGMGRRVHFSGARTDARDLLPAFDAYVNCSITEGISLTVLEAMAARVPVVATRVGGTPEIITDSDTGVLVSPGDPDALARGIMRILAAPRRSLEMAARARQRIEARFSFERMAADYLQTYAAAGGAA
jgi:glycosyltransferase involved in cell wall biosynthesis